MKKPVDEPRLDAAATGKKSAPSQDVVVNSIEYEGPAEKKTLTAPPPTLASRFTRVANRYYFKERPTQEAFVDHGERLRTRHNHPLVANAMVDLAESRGWDTLTVNGHTDFKQAVWLEASLKGLSVTGYTPTAQDQAAWRARQQAQEQATLHTHQSARGQATLRPSASPTVAPAINPPPAPTASSTVTAPATLAAGATTHPEPVATTTAHAAQQRESRQAAIRDPVMAVDRQARQEQHAPAQAEQRRQAQQQEQAAQLRTAVDTLDKRSAIQRYPELARLYPLLAEAENFARAQLRPENRAEFVEQIKDRSVQELARGETLPTLPPVAEKAARQDRSQARGREPAAEIER